MENNLIFTVRYKNPQDPAEGGLVTVWPVPGSEALVPLTYEVEVMPLLAIIKGTGIICAKTGRVVEEV